MRVKPVINIVLGILSEVAYTAAIMLAALFVCVVLYTFVPPVAGLSILLQ